MNKHFLFASLFALGVMATPVAFTSCSSDDPVVNPDNKPAGEAFACIEQILDGCNDIANEVGESKIGTPISLEQEGKHTEALYAVESWYSFHSREDYSNNIYSIRNAYYGTRDGSIAEHSLSKLVAGVNPTLDAQVKTAISEAAQAILDIPNPFRNNIASAQSIVAQAKCAALKDKLTELKGYIENNGAINQDENLDPVIQDYVNNVVLPTYRDLKDGNSRLYDAVLAFQANPSNDGFKAVAEAWLNARAPWETSEAFLFGPVDALGLDPNMDSWPLDQDQIMTILTSGKYNDLDWTDDNTEDEIANIQAVRGFHTLEFLTFRNGVARTLNDVAASDDNADVVYNAQNAASWGNYMKQVAFLLKRDAESLYNAWTVSYEGGDSFAKQFLSHNFH